MSFQCALHCVHAESVAICWILVRFPTLERCCAFLLTLGTGDFWTLTESPVTWFFIPKELTYNAPKFHNKYCLFFAFEGPSQSKIFFAQ